MYRFVVRPWRGPDRRHASVKDAFDDKRSSDETVLVVWVEGNVEVKVVGP